MWNKIENILPVFFGGMILGYIIGGHIGSYIGAALGLYVSINQIKKTQ